VNTGLPPLISVIVPVYNGAAYVSKCLDSILMQTYPAFEVVLINDGSTDQTPAICSAYACKESRIRYITQENHGLAAARNIGVQASEGDYICFADADDWVEPTYLSYLYELLLTSHCLISACNHWICRGSALKPRFPVSDSQRVLTPQEAFRHILYDHCPDVSAWGKLYTKSVLREIRYPESRLFEDTYRIAEIILAGGGLAYGSKPQYFYRIRRESLSRGGFSQSKLDYLSAVDHMTEVMAAHCEGLEKGIARRKMHALLSVRRSFVGCGGAETEIRDMLERRIRDGAALTLRDMRSPLRDKAGVLSVLMGAGVYDAMWKAYEGIRRK
jgi:glycosyltransferase involved in cell wall biosynthesis